MQINFFYIVLLALLMTTSSCRKDGGGRRSSSSPAPTTSAPTAKTPEKKKSETPVAAPKKEDIPDIGNDKAVVINTGAESESSYLTFISTAAKDEGRRKSEFLLIIRAGTESCVSLKARPSSGITSGIAEETLSDKSVSGSCKDFAVKEEPKKTEQQAALTSFNFTSVLNDTLQLTTTSPSLCDFRLFRMTNEKNQVVIKTGRLAAISGEKSVRVWVDDEIGNICAGGSTPVDMPAVSFGPLSTIYDPANHKDKLTIKHLQNIASEGQRILKTLTGNFGAVSDVDKNAGVEIFVSPDVNRKNFIRFDTTVVDHFRVNLIYKPEDLARYNTSTNPTSNEGEVVYLWAPDPAGLYANKQYPTSNSLTSNYAKGFIGSQIMNLISINTRLIVNKTKPEEQWLANALSLLAADYVGGNDFTSYSKGLYLMSRPQELSLTDGVSKSVPDDLKSFANDAWIGNQAIFGWYLHSMLCGEKTVAPCAKIKNLITSSKIGAENVEVALGIKFPEILTHFGVSVGLSLVDDPAASRKIYNDTSTQLDSIALPSLTEINVDSPPQTVENVNNASSIVEGIDRTVAGPFPTLDELLFQPILPDNDLDLILEKNSVTYVLLTHAVTDITEVLAFFGPNLNVSIVPIGERNDTLRKIHEEKISENAYMDLRSVNLTSAAASNKTYYNSPVYSTDYSVNAQRELWALGSIENFKVDVESKLQETSDSDSYNIKIKPCEGAANQASCEAEGYKDVIVQVIPRDSQGQVLPMVYLTVPSLNLFRGKMVLGLYQNFDQDFKEKVSVEENVYITALCESALLADDGANATDCANGGVLPTTYNTNVCGVFLSEGACNGNNRQSTFFEQFTYSQYSNGVGPVFDNFLHSSPYGYPFYNHGLMTYVGAPVRQDLREFNKQEYIRQFFNFTYKKDSELRHFNFKTIHAGQVGVADGVVDADYDKNLETISSDHLIIYDSIKKLYATPNTEQFTEDSKFVSNCTSLGIEVKICKKGALDGELKNAAKTLLADNKRIICNGMVCLGKGLNADGDIWISPSRIITILTSSSNNNYSTYFEPVYATQTSEFCKGKDVASSFSTCQIDEVKLASGSDIRAQLNLPADKLKIGCVGLKFREDFHACGDVLSYKLLTEPEVLPGFTFMGEKTGIEKVRTRPLNMGNPKGEVIAVPKRTHYNLFKVPAAGETTIHVLIGGANKTQGDYILRVRVKDYN